MFVLTGTNSNPLGRVGGLGGVWVFLGSLPPLLIIFGRGRRWIGLCISVGFSLKAKIG